MVQKNLTFMMCYFLRNNENILITLEGTILFLYIVYEKIKGTYKGRRTRNLS